MSCGRPPFSVTVRSLSALTLESIVATHFAGSGFVAQRGLCYRSSEVMAMTKAELVEDVARAAELTKKDAERLVEIVFESIIETLNHGEKIELRGFGSFRVRERGARRGRNPKTGDPVNIPAKRVPYFKPGKELKELINEESAPAQSSPDVPGAGDRTPPVL